MLSSYSKSRGRSEKQQFVNFSASRGSPAGCRFRRSRRPLTETLLAPTPNACIYIAPDTQCMQLWIRMRDLLLLFAVATDAGGLLASCRPEPQGVGRRRIWRAHREPGEPEGKRRMQAEVCSCTLSPDHHFLEAVK